MPQGVFSPPKCIFKVSQQTVAKRQEFLIVQFAGFLCGQPLKRVDCVLVIVLGFIYLVFTEGKGLS